MNNAILGKRWQDTKGGIPSNIPPLR